MTPWYAVRLWYGVRFWYTWLTRFLVWALQAELEGLRREASIVKEVAQQLMDTERERDEREEHLRELLAASGTGVRLLGRPGVEHRGIEHGTTSTSRQQVRERDEREEHLREHRGREHGGEGEGSEGRAEGGR